MLPGKVYKPEDFIKILRKRIWVVVVPWAIIAAGTAGVARLLPDVYSSSALIQVVPPRVPGNIVQSMTSSNLEERLRGVEQTIVSRTRLERLIQDLNLYPEERRSMIMQDVVEMMRRQIQRSPVRGDAFTVTFSGRERTKVQEVAARLAGFYIAEGKADGQSRAEDTSTFIEGAVEEARRKLAAAEARITEYKLRHSGELPSERGSNQMAIQTTQQQLQSLTQLISADITQKIFLERQIDALEAASENAAAPFAPPPSKTQELLDGERTRLGVLKAQGMGASHPRVVEVQGRIKQLEKQLQTELLNSPVAMGGGVSLAEQNRRKQLQSLKAELENVKRSLADKQSQEKILRAQAAGYQARIDRAPIREAELIELTRDYETYSRAYNELVSNQIKTDLAVDVERRQIGEQFRLLDQARLPERPTSPNRLLINIFGLLGGLAFGLGLVALLEYRDRSFKTDTDVVNVLSLPVLAVVPYMQSDTERRAAFRKRLVLNTGLAGMVVVCAAVVAYSFVFLR